MRRDESRLIQTASAWTARLDEAMRHHPNPHLVRRWFRRAEAVAVASAEQLGASEITLAMMIDGSPPDVIGREDRTAKDLHGALSLLDAWGPESPGDDELIELWRASEKSNQRRGGDALEWRLEQECAVAAAEIRGVLATPDPWSVAGALRMAWNRDGLEGRARRIGLLTAPHMVARAFGVSLPIVGVSRFLASEADATRRAAADEDDWPGHFFEAVAAGARRSYDAAAQLARLDRDLKALCPPERSSSRVVPAIEAILANPIVTQTSLAGTLGTTHRGAGWILDRLVGAGIVSALDGAGAKTRAFICRKAVGL